LFIPPRSIRKNKKNGRNAIATSGIRYPDERGGGEAEPWETSVQKKKKSGCKLPYGKKWPNALFRNKKKKKKIDRTFPR